MTFSPESGLLNLCNAQLRDKNNTSRFPSFPNSDPLVIDPFLFQGQLLPSYLLGVSPGKVISLGPSLGIPLTSVIGGCSMLPGIIIVYLS